MPSQKIVAGYGRVSTIKQATEGTSFKDQRQRIEQFCTKEGYELYEFYADEGISGKTMEHRPGMQKLIADAQAGKSGISHYARRNYWGGVSGIANQYWNRFAGFCFRPIC